MTDPYHQAAQAITAKAADLAKDAVTQWAAQSGMTPEQWLEMFVPVVETKAEGAEIRVVVRAMVRRAEKK